MKNAMLDWAVDKYAKGEVNTKPFTKLTKDRMNKERIARGKMSVIERYGRGREGKTTQAEYED